MNEYKKRLAQQGDRQLNSESAAAQSVNGIPNSALNAVFAGTRRATSEMMGHREDPAPSVIARMSQSFGMDFSGVQVYRSDAMNGTGMHGMAQGNKVVIGSDVNLNTTAGQAILGHEFSHIRAQSMGIGTGNGLLRDAALEHQADSEGMLAARGMNISGESMGMSMGLGMAGVENLSPIGSGLSASAGAPMQAEKDEEAKALEADYDYKSNLPEAPKAPVYDENKDILEQIEWMNNVEGAQDFVRGESIEAADLPRATKGRRRSDKLYDPKLNYNGNVDFTGRKYRHRDGTGTTIAGLYASRLTNSFDFGIGSDFSDEYLQKMLLYMAAGGGEKASSPGGNKKSNNIKGLYDAQHMKGLKMYKEVIYHELKKQELKYGKVLHQMSAEDVAKHMGVFEATKFGIFKQDMTQYDQTTNGKNLNKALRFEDEEKEEDFNRLVKAFADLHERTHNYDTYAQTLNAVKDFSEGNKKLLATQYTRNDRAMKGLTTPSDKENKLVEHEVAEKFINFGPSLRK